jgi:regulator of protease activity HflC (stomatin/prohibitin superfamily)
MDSSIIYIILAIIVGLVLFIYVVSGINVVSEWNRRPVLRFGKYSRTLSPGISWVNPLSNTVLDDVAITDSVTSMDMDALASLQTRDNIPVAFTTVMTTRVDPENVEKFTIVVQQGRTAVESRTLTAVGEVISGRDLNDILHNHGEIGNQIVQLLQSRVAAWGIKVIAVELRNIKIVDEGIQEAIALEARAKKEAAAELVRAQAQVAIAKELNKAAVELSAEGWRLKNLEAIIEHRAHPHRDPRPPRIYGSSPHRSHSQEVIQSGPG